MQVTKGTWRMREQCVPGSPSSSPAQEPGNEATSLSAFVISKTHISGQKPRGRQLNKKVCGSKSAIFVILLLCSDHFVKQR